MTFEYDTNGYRQVTIKHIYDSETFSFLFRFSFKTSVLSSALAIMDFYKPTQTYVSVGWVHVLLNRRDVNIRKIITGT